MTQQNPFFNPGSVIYNSAPEVTDKEKGIDYFGAEAPVDGKLLARPNHPSSETAGVTSRQHKDGKTTLYDQIALNTVTYEKEIRQNPV